MDGSTIGLIITFTALGVAAGALAWNMYQDHKCQARVRLKAEIREKPGKKAKKLKGQYITISVMNQGPKPVEILNLWAANISFVRKALLKGRGEKLDPVASFQLPREVAAGETIDLLVPFHKDCFLQKDYTNVGVIDFYDREHWVPKSQIGKLKRAYQERFRG